MTAPLLRSPLARGKDVVRLAGRALLTVALLAFLLIAWQVVTTRTTYPFFPPPWTVLQNMGTLLFSGPPSHLWLSDTARSDALPTLTRMVLGFLLGSTVGVVLGTVVGLFRTASELSTPVIEFLRSVPAAATLPLFIIVLGAGSDMRVLFIAFGVVWFVLINTANGVSSIHETQLMMGRSFRVAWWRQLIRIVLPAASPQMFAGLRVALSSSLIFAVVSEFQLASNGAGYQLVNAQARFQILDMWTWIFFLAFVGLILNLLLALVERWALSWHRAQRV